MLDWSWQKRHTYRQLLHCLDILLRVPWRCRIWIIQLLGASKVTDHVSSCQTEEKEALLDSRILG
jgi:hypothetical protein